MPEGPGEDAARMQRGCCAATKQILARSYPPSFFGANNTDPFRIPTGSHTGFLAESMRVSCHSPFGVLLRSLQPVVPNPFCATARGTPKLGDDRSAKELHCQGEHRSVCSPADALTKLGAPAWWYSPWEHFACTPAWCTKPSLEC